MTALEELFSKSSTRLQFGNFSASGANLHYAQTDTSGPPLVLLHGANIGMIQWYKVIDKLSDIYTLYLIDMPGAGKSSKVHYRHADLDADIVKPIQEFIGSIVSNNEYSIIGHSFGGWIALKLSLGPYPPKKLVLSNSLGFSSFLSKKFYPLALYPTTKLLIKSVMRLNKKNMEGFLKSVLRQPQTVDDLFVDAFFESLTEERHPFLFINRLLQPFRLRDELVLSQALPQMNTPALVTTSKYDPFIRENDIREILADNPHFSLVHLTDSGHAPMIETPELFVKTALDYLCN